MTNQAADSTFEAAFDAHWSWVCRTLHRLVGDWDEAEDLAQEVFYRLYQRPPQDRRKVAGWLHRTAINAGLNALRARKRRWRYEEEAGTLNLQSANSVDPATEIEHREERQLVRRVLAQMKPRAAKLLVLRHSSLSYAEIAVALNTASSSVGTLLNRAEREFERRYRALEGNDETL